MSRTTWDGLDEAIIGATTKGQVVYDVELIIQELMKMHKDWDRQDALEWFYHNIDGAYIGENTPIHMYRVEDEEE